MSGIPSHCCCCGLGCGCIFIGFIFLVICIPILAGGTVWSLEYRKNHGLLYTFCKEISGNLERSIGTIISDYGDFKTMLCGHETKIAVEVVANFIGVLAAWSAIEALLSVGLMWGAAQESIGWTTAWLVGTSSWATLIISLTVSFVCTLPDYNYIVMFCIGGFIYVAIAIFSMMIVTKFRKELLENASQQQNNRIQGVAVVNPTMQMVPAYHPHWQMPQGPITMQPYATTNPYPSNHSYSPNQQNGDQQWS